LAPLVADSDHWLDRGIPLKRGRTATLALVELGGRKLVIKRYNIKSPGHALSRCWRPSRAWHSWVEGHRLSFLGIATPRPLAMIEQRLGPLRGRAWLIVEYCAGESLATHLAGFSDVEPPAAELQAVRELFSKLADAHVSHGDLKATNLLWSDEGLNLIDLDAMRQHVNATSYARAWRKDRARFLQNWPDDSALRCAMETVLPAA
jgi:tRNA A-37 threonylcarbamoyl transferase component Bud32